MPVATVTVRQLKNQLSGLDLCIPTVKEIPGILVDTIEYHVLVVSNLQFFKLPQHKESDVVQFVIPKRFEDFENLRKGLIHQYPGTVLPVLSSSILSSLLESNSSERTAELDNFLKFISVTPKLATSHITLEFLGVNPLTAGKYTISPKVSSTQSGDSSKKSSTTQSPDFQLFKDVQEEPSDLFGSELDKEDDVGDEMFGLKIQSSDRTGAVKLFEDQFSNLDDVVSKDDLKTFGLPEDEVAQASYIADNEDVSKILEVGDEISKLLKLEEAVKVKQKTRHSEVLLQGQKKDIPSSRISTAPSINSSKPHLPPKPSVGHKPVLLPKPVVSPLSKGDAVLAADSKEKPLTSALGVADILNYIKDNAVDDDVEPALF